VWPSAREACDFFYSKASNQKCIADQRAMTSPGHSFGAHYRGSPVFTDFDELIQGSLKFWCLHVIGEPAEARISPPSIDRVTAHAAAHREQPCAGNGCPLF
jgi:hypothetical protein